ncbi:response regulator transcription factor [Nocardioides sp. HDW12B]|uniref:response regulator n=1 Tax=Nocardioides sp. HDW12B TaxID=2714939 RepID=UPI00140D77F0|nr:response regulator transcription factor [Nocardioides sp. HDW12B]QIK67228.1 response regulator transcription factor [Nocardioides sp. HDW12B]
MNASRAVRVVIADDHATVLSAVVNVVEGEPGFEVVGSVGTGHEAVEVAREQRADLVLIDVQMPSGGAVAAAALTRLRPAPVVVAISGQTAASTLEDLLLAGVTGFVTKGHAGTDLVEVLERCARGEVVLASPAAASALASLVARAGRPSPT